METGVTASLGSTLILDIGGTGIKSLCVNEAGIELVERERLLTPQPPTPENVLGVIETLIAHNREKLHAEGIEDFDRVAIGYPGVVMSGLVKTAHNLGGQVWYDFDLAAAVERLGGKPTLVVNDADLQGFGVISGVGVELVLTLGTGLGTALYTEGFLVANLEFAHHPFEEGKTYEEQVGDAPLKEVGAHEWSARVHRMLDVIQRIFNPATIHLGGGNVRHIEGELPENVHVFENAAGMTGGVKLWKSALAANA